MTENEQTNATESTNLDFLEAALPEDSALETMIEVDHVSMIFNMASEQLNSLKEYAISLARRELRFKEFRALDDVSLTVKRGDVFGIMGTNGSGKSTLLKIIAGVLDPTQGTCTVNGTIAPLIELGAGFDLELTARENIYLNGALLGYSKEFINEHFDEIVAFAEIRPFLDMPLKNYSSGMVARIAFAIATVIVPDILIVDEVLSVGDFMFQQKCERRIQSLIRDHGVTVLIVSHNSDQVERLCNKAIWIEKGHTRMVGLASEVCDIYRSIGGRTGSKEAEILLYDTMKSALEPAEDRMETISGENRYAISAQLFERSFEDARAKGTVVLASGEDASACMVASAFAGTIGASFLLTKRSSVPDSIAQALQNHNLNDVFIAGEDSFVAEKTVQEIARLADAEMHVIPGDTLQDLTMSIYYAGEEFGEGWGDTALVTYDGCIGDLASFMPYAYTKRCPVFFCVGANQLDKATKVLFDSKRFDRLISLGGLSFELIDEYRAAGLEVERIVGSSLANASQMINAWEVAHGLSFKGEIVLSSIWNLNDALSASAYAGVREAMLWLEDSQSLDSLGGIIEFILGNGEQVENLTFIGDETRFNDNDKQLLGKALRQAKRTFES